MINPTRWYAGLLLLLFWPACGDDGPEVRGLVDRVVGETVTLELVQGEPGFSGELTLRASNGVVFQAAALKASKKSESSLSFTIPPDIAQGPATASLGRQGDGAAYAVPLQINRLVLALYSQGNLEALPLPPATITQSSLAVGGGGLISISPGGGQVAVAVGNRVRLFSLGSQLKEVTPGVDAPGPVLALAATPGGALVAVSDSIILYRFAAGQAVTQTSTTLTAPRALAVNEAGDRGAVVYHCDTDSDKTADSECAGEVLLGSAVTIERWIALDPTPSAAWVSVTRDGKGAVIADADKIYGAYFDDAPHVSSVGWGPAARTVGIGHVPALADQNAVDLFAVADAVSKRVVFAAFNPKANNTLQILNQPKTVDLPAVPSGLGFGYGADLLVPADSGLYRIDAGVASPTATKLEGVPLTANPLVSFAVQP